MNHYRGRTTVRASMLNKVPLLITSIINHTTLTYYMKRYSGFFQLLRINNAFTRTLYFRFIAVMLVHL